ncbi:MAG: hypothetical protein AAGC55_05825 [Myxococcota bacterium]
MSIIEIALGAVIPGLVAAIALLILARPWQEGREAILPAVLAPSLLLGILAGYGYIAGKLPELWPTAGTERLVHIAVLGAVACVFETRLSGAARWAVRGAVGFIAAWMLLGPLARLTGATAIAAMVGSAALLAVYWEILARFCAREPRLVGAGLALVIAGGVAAAVGASGSLIFGRLAGTLAAGVGAVLVGMFLFSRLTSIAGAAGLIAVVTWSFVLASYGYSEMVTPVVAILAALPLVVAGAALATRGLSGRLGSAVRLAVPAIAVIAALGLAAMPPADDGGASGGDEYDYGYGYE